MSASEKRPEARCQILKLDLVLVCGGITAFVLILCFSAVSFWRGRRGQVTLIQVLSRLLFVSVLRLCFLFLQIKRSFRPTAPPRLERPHRHRSCSCNSHPPQIESYLVTSLQSAYFNRWSAPAAQPDFFCALLPILLYLQKKCEPPHPGRGAARRSAARPDLKSEDAQPALFLFCTATFLLKWKDVFFFFLRFDL